MQTYQCPDCGDEVTINDRHSCNRLKGIIREDARHDELEVREEMRAARYDGLTQDQHMDDPHRGAVPPFGSR